ncbi:unnamed protein product, partial [Rotaria socialis]
EDLVNDDDWTMNDTNNVVSQSDDDVARYVLALVAKDKPLDKLRENCIDRLEVFLDRGL